MLILGISEMDNDSGAVLIRDGELVGACNEERLTRVKQQDGMPSRSVEWLLRKAGASPTDLDRVIAVRQDVSREYAHSLRTMDEIKHFAYPGPLNWKLLNWAAWKFNNYPKTRKMSQLQNENLLAWIRDSRIDPQRVERIDHHFMHATCAYYGSGFDKALAFTTDGQGDGRTATIYLCENGKFTLVHDVWMPHSAGTFYASITKAAGYRPARHEGKITGLAARGCYDDEVMSFVTKMLYNVEGSFEAPYIFGAYPKLKSLLRRKGPEKLAWAYQHVLEDVMSRYVQHYMKKTGAKNLCTAGGVVANVRLNQKLHELPEVENIFIFPHMPDGGLGWGAAWYAWHRHEEQRRGRDYRYTPKKIHDVYWGPSYSDEEVAAALDRAGVKYTRPENYEAVLADLLVDGELIARFQGAMEFGPRALCHRSIIYQPTDGTVNDWLNKDLHRTEFMPFAPVTLEEDANLCYQNMRGAEHPANFMTITFYCTEQMARNCPAVVHVDNTARPQTVRPDLDASTHKLLLRYKERTGLSSLINTSFNMHEEPIVCSPEDAIRSCRDAHFRYLAIGPYLAEFPFPSPPLAKPSRKAT